VFGGEPAVLLPGNPFGYPDNLPRVNAHRGPEGRPGCWQKVTQFLWPFPYLGREVGETTINP
jgi:phospholipid/cholesterol/gamma-HCH transport system substrate-binding protein